MSADLAIAVQQASAKWGGQYKRKTANEAAGACPFCADGRDRFVVFADGGYWCRVCDVKGWINEGRELTEQERLDLRLRAVERKQVEMEARLSALEQMHRCTDHLRYHRNLTDEGLGFDYWASEGMTADTIQKYRLGYCLSCPTLPGYASYTIPVTHQGKLYNIRHRIAKPIRGGKYRPHMPGLPSMLFNYDDTQARDKARILVLEGEKKSIIVSQETGQANVATMGACNFKPEWAPKLGAFGLVYVCYDPDARDKAAQTAQLFGAKGRLMNLPVKADDFFTVYGGRPVDFENYLSKARRVA